MTYSPGSPGYPPGPQPTTQFSVPAQPFGKPPEAGSIAPEGLGRLPIYLNAAVAVLGLAVYLASFGTLFTATTATAGVELIAPITLYLSVVAALLGGLLAGAGLLPKQTPANAVVAALSVLGFLLAIWIVIETPDGISIAYGLYLILAFTALQAIIAVITLLLEADIIAQSAPRLSYEQQQYAQYGGQGMYYGQPQHRGPQHAGQPQQLGPQHQRQGYPSLYGGGGYPGGPSTGGFSAAGPQNGPPTPPTGFPTYGRPQQQQPSSTPSTQAPAQPQSSSSPQSGPSQS